MKILNLLKKTTKSKGKSYFDLSARERKKIIKKAAEESNKMQRDVIKRYNQLVSA